MKTVIVNGSPRKSWNTATILKSVKDGAASAGGQVEYIDLFDLKFAGCRSCLACKRKGIEEPCKCYFKDELSPVLESIYSADRLIIGSPIYFGQPTGQVRNLLERAVFPALSYNDYSSIFKGSIDVDIFLTMNITEEPAKKMYGPAMSAYFDTFKLLNGDVRIHYVCDTLQVNDYSKYDMAGFNGEHKKEWREKHFPIDLKEAYETGKGNV